MEEPVKDQSSASENKGKLVSRLRYPLRSAAKSAMLESPNPSAPKSVRPISSVSKSVGVLNLSGKDKSGKPPRRLSALAKSSVSPLPRPLGSITPISETRATKLANSPNSDISRSSTRKKFCVLSSASYWLMQIKLSESAAKHGISIGLFKLALEAGCEPLQKMRDELKAYARRHNLAELGEPAKNVLENYNISENVEPQVSETISQVIEDGSQSSDSSSSITKARKLKPKSLEVDATSAKASPTVAKIIKQSATAKEISGPKTRVPSNKKSANSIIASENVGHSISKKSQKQTKKKSDVNKCKTQKKEKEIFSEKAPADMPIAEPLQENKENMDSPQTEQSSLVEA